MNQGWECPRCKVVSAPFMPQCSNIRCLPETYTVSTDGTGPYNHLSGNPISTGILGDLRHTGSSLKNDHQNCSCPNCVPEKYGKKINSFD